ncbi:TadE/TadG family type IV pilus assembly protein [Mesorhizobium sp. L103C119B0]|uniref:TadE/TadG family type IV pilus assembly protein n=1 Tax=Mesorhizobium sp. L103C119B0 TaxID=1287085 RepID=UPI0004CEE779|nr:TadE/TadG family type IV pilus assembly protein [Mesorhizobium sp. L103C119B0]
MKRKIFDLLFDDRGYVTALTLISMPMLLGLSLLIIDVSRGNNLHTDLQNAVDGLALAGARELNGAPDAITRANAAIADLVKNQARFSNGGPITMDQTKVSVAYLTTIPPTDDTSINAAWIATNGTTDGTAAAYVLVRSTPRAMTSLFPLPVGLATQTLNFQAEAVATYTAAACDVTPMFICNPFEAQNLSMQQAYAQGLTYSRELQVLKTDSTPGPGNFGLLDTDIPLKDAFAKGASGQCYTKKSVVTKTGVTFGQVNVGLNVRFDIYAGSLGSAKSDPLYRPATNVRKGAKFTTGSSGCGKVDSDVPTKAMGFGPGTYPTPSLGISTNGSWDRAGYWSLNHVSTPFPAALQNASRYDVYRYEIAHNLVADRAGNKGSGENGVPRCYTADPATLSDKPDRRTIFAAVVNCGDFSDSTKHTTISGKTTLKPDAFVSMFLTNPVEKQDNSKEDDTTASEKPIRLEIVDVTGQGGSGTLDQFLREEAQLVR